MEFSQNACTSHFRCLARILKGNYLVVLELVKVVNKHLAHFKSKMLKDGKYY